MKCKEKLFLIKMMPDYIKFNNHSYNYDCGNEIFKGTKDTLGKKKKKKKKREF